MYRRPYLLTALVCLGLLASSFAYFPITTTIARETSPNQPDYLPGWSWYQQVTITNSTAAPLAGWEGHVWSDTFSDATGITTPNNISQMTDSTGGVFGTAFTPYAGNPLSTLESSDPWDADGDIWKQIPGAVHPDVQYFPDGVDGYKFWMIFTPLAYVSNPPGGYSNDYWWERPTLVRSNDGIHWVKTPDYTNPLVSPGAAGRMGYGWLSRPRFCIRPGQRSKSANHGSCTVPAAAVGDARSH